MYHQACRNCSRILTIEEMNEHLKDNIGLCSRCRSDKLHADTLIERIVEAQKEEVNND